MGSVRPDIIPSVCVGLHSDLEYTFCEESSPTLWVTFRPKIRRTARRKLISFVYLLNLYCLFEEQSQAERTIRHIPSRFRLGFHDLSALGFLGSSDTCNDDSFRLYLQARGILRIIYKNILICCWWLSRNRQIFALPRNYSSIQFLKYPSSNSDYFAPDKRDNERNIVINTQTANRLTMSQKI